jgi:hypothetical protein
MKALTAKDAKYGFGRLIDLARAEPVAKHGPSVVVMAVGATSAAVRADRGLREIQGHWGRATSSSASAHGPCSFSMSANPALQVTATSAES